MQPVPSIDDRGARNCVCVSRCVQPWFRQIKVVSGTFQTAVHTQDPHTHTHTESSGVFRVSVWFGAYHYTLQGKPGLTKADWHCQELWEQSDLIYIRAPSCCCVKCFFVGKSLPQQSWRSGVGAASMKLEEAASPTMEKLHSPDQSWRSRRELCVDSQTTNEGKLNGTDRTPKRRPT